MNYKPPIRDEIPGLSSFLYEANRYRKPHEYVGYAEKLAKIEGKLRESGVNVNMEDPADVAERILSLYEENRQNQEYAEDFYDQIEKLRNEKELAQAQLMNIRKQMEEANKVLKDFENRRIEALFFMLQYGDHRPDCGYIEVLNSGRGLDIDEKEECTCGWIDIRGKILENPDNLGVLKLKVDKDDLINCKPLKKPRDLDID